ncbi:hypothetical protein BCR42DRAFT_311828, partial [Absidia repens]
LQKPTTFRKIQAIAIGNEFDKVTDIVTVNYDTFSQKLKPHQVIIKVLYVGINASDVNYTNGKYTPGVKPPFDVGFEGLGQVVEAGSAVPKEKIGRYAIFSQYGAFSEYLTISVKGLIPVPNPKPEYIGLLTSGLTASISLAEKGQMKSGETVLVTAAAGGTGQFAVQLAKLAGNHVIGTCSSDDKVEMLKRMGCDRVINYKKEDFKKVLRDEYPRGVDIVLAVKGRLIVIGMASTYSSTNGMQGNEFSTIKLLGKSRTVTGFFLPDYAELFGKYLQELIGLSSQRKLEVELD